MDSNAGGKYSIFRQSRVTTLWSRRNGWFRPTYELTDGTYSYGELSCYGFLRPVTEILTANGLWTFENFRCRNTNIFDHHGTLIGQVQRKFFTNTTTFITADGFRANWYRLSFWRSEYVWQEENGRVLLRYTSTGISTTEAFIFEGPAGYENPYVLLLAFLALEFKLRRRRGAMAAG